MTTDSQQKTIKNDLKQLGYDFIHIYPRTAKWLVDNWQVTLIFIAVLWSAFYLDTAVRYWVLLLKSTTLDPIMRFGWWYGTGQPTLYLFLIFFFGGLILKNYKYRKAGLLVMESYIYSGLVTLVFKSFFGRARPYTNLGDLDFEWFIIGSNDTYSFSSGHACIAFALSTVLASLTKNKYFKFLLYLIAAITSISRIYHDQHWFSDVITGSFIGTLITALLINMSPEEKTILPKTVSKNK